MTAHLSVVGVGYNVAGQVTPESLWWMRNADRLFYLVTDSATSAWLRTVNETAESLHGSYEVGESGLDASHLMVERILEPLDEGLSVCAAFTGHPAILLVPPHEAMREARLRGHTAHMLPGISFEDVMVADVGIDPARHGRALFDATDFLIHPRTVDTSSLLVLMQVGAIGEREYRNGTEPNLAGVEVLVERLSEHYPSSHTVILYERSQLPTLDSVIEYVPLSDLPRAPLTVRSTLVVPPLSEREPDAARLGELEAQRTNRDPS